MSLIAEFGTVCEKAARVGGNVLRDHWGRVQAREKNPADLVTEADIASQRAIRDVLLGAFPDHGFLAEENESIESRQDSLRWIVDPLDGTTNFVHGIPTYAVSIGLEQAGKLLVGVVYEPAIDRCYSAAFQEGAFVDGQRLHASQTTELAKAVVATSFPPRIRKSAPEIVRFLAVLTRCRATRRSGSTALNLCWVAAGQFDAYWTYATRPWDVAAGGLIVREAGGAFTGPGGREFDLAEASFVAAATPALHQELCRTLDEVARGS